MHSRSLHILTHKVMPAFKSRMGTAQGYLYPPANPGAKQAILLLGVWQTPCNVYSCDLSTIPSEEDVRPV